MAYQRFINAPLQPIVTAIRTSAYEKPLAFTTYRKDGLTHRGLNPCHQQN